MRKNTPLLITIAIDQHHSFDADIFPFSLPLIHNLKEIQFQNQVTFFVGENGSGKSTILEAIAHNAGFDTEMKAKSFEEYIKKGSGYAFAKKRFW